MKISTQLFETIRLMVLMTIMAILIYTLPTIATEFFNDFEKENIPNVSTFTIANNGVKATLKGGSLSQLHRSLIYEGKKSWVVESAGSNERGDHSGFGIITFNVPMSQLSFWVRSNSALAVATVTLLDIDGNQVENNARILVSNDEWMQIEYTTPNGSPALKSIHLNVTGVGVAAIDNLYGASEADIAIHAQEALPDNDTPTSVSRYATREKN